MKFVKKQEVEELECDSDDHDTPLAWIKQFLLKLTIQLFCTGFLQD